MTHSGLQMLLTLSATIAALASTQTTAAQNTTDLVLVEQGMARSCIVIPDNALPVESFAADELRYHVHKATGTFLPIVAENSADPSRTHVVLGNCKAARAAGIDLTGMLPNSFIIRRVNNRFFMAGVDSDGPVGHKTGTLHNNRTRVGTLFAVYHFLEHDLGVRWLWPGELGEVIPWTLTISVDTYDITRPPILIHSRFRDYAMRQDRYNGWTDREHADRFYREQAVWLRRHRFALGEDLDVRHAFTKWWDRYGQDHPEYFNMLPDGTRRPDPVSCAASPKLVHMCVSNQNLQDKIVDVWAERRSDGMHGLDVSENDGMGGCCCPQCLAMDAVDPNLDIPHDQRLNYTQKAWRDGDKLWHRYLGSLSDRYARFMLAVQKRAEKIDPEVIVLNHAYSNYVKPPVNTPLNDRIILSVVPPYGFPWADQHDIQQNRAIWDGWRNAGARLLLRPNYMLSGHGLPLIIPEVVGDEFTHAFNNGMIGTDYGALTGQYGLQSPALYMVVRKHTAPNTPSADILREYLRAFGPAADDIHRFIEYWTDYSRSLKKDMFDSDIYAMALKSHGYFHQLLPKILTREVLTRSFDILDQAAASAAGDGRASQRVMYIRKGLVHAELMADVQRQYDHYADKGDIEPYLDAMKRLEQYRREQIEPTTVANLKNISSWERYTWDPGLLDMFGSQDGTPLDTTWRFAFDPNNVGIANKWFDPGFDATGWTTITTMSTWEQQPAGIAWQDEHHTQYDGYAWYRQTFGLPDGDDGKTWRLIFGAVDEACRVWVNGTLLLNRPFPYQGNTHSWSTPFEVNFTSVAKPGQVNTVVVRVEDNSGAGGIWKPVFLQVSQDNTSANRNSLIINGGFEHLPIKAWRKSIMKGTCRLKLDYDVAFSGKASARITCTKLEQTGTKPVEKAWARWVQTVEVDPRDTYDMSVMVRTDKAFNGRIDVWYIDQTDRNASRIERMANTQELWKKVSITGIAPAGPKAVVYVNLVGGVGSLWLDQVTLTPAAR